MQSQALHFTCKIKQGCNFNRLGLPTNTAALEVARVCVNKCVLSRFENIINSSLNCITTKSVGDLPLRSLGFLLPRHLVPSPSYCGMISQKVAKYLLNKIFQPISWLIQIHMLYYWTWIWNCWSERELKIIPKIICQFWTEKSWSFSLLFALIESERIRFSLSDLRSGQVKPQRLKK